MTINIQQEIEYGFKYHNSTSSRHPTFLEGLYTEIDKAIANKQDERYLKALIEESICEYFSEDWA